MKRSDSPPNSKTTRLFAATALFATLALPPSVTLATDHDAHEDRTEMRIKDMHTKLHITPAQEELWTKVTTAMRDNAKTMDTLTQARFDHAMHMTAVDDLKSYGEITAAQADGIEKLTPAFSTLYASMSTTQQKHADILFRNGPRDQEGDKTSAIK
jgi:periplasmic protein CpxP/Spy